MDAVDYDQAVYQKIKSDYREFAKALNIEDVRFVPISALKGDNVVNESEHMPWYPGSPLLKLLNTVQINGEKSDSFRFPVQYVSRPNLDFRGFAGTIASGEIRVGDTIVALPSGKQSKIKSIVTFDGELETAYADMAITLTLEDEIDVSRGDMLVRPHEQPYSASAFSADVVWMDEASLQIDREYIIKVGTNVTVGSVDKIEYSVNVNSMEKQSVLNLALNEIGRCNFTVNKPVQFDAYEDNRQTGAFIIIDRLTNATVGAGMIASPLAGSEKGQSKKYSEYELELNTFVRKHFPHWGAKDLTVK